MIQPDEIIVDLFAGGGGASEGIRMALGRDPDVAVNHDPVAVAMHAANHPGTRHLRQDVWQVPPRWATGRRPVGLLWASPDCTHFSKAKGGTPRRERKRRDLAWVVEKWAREVRPRMILLENVEEFRTWGPLDKDGCIIPSQKGTTFCAFVRRLRRLGYAVEWKDLRGCDYGAPTIRKRLFLIARCDGLPIVWPEPTHGPGRIPYRTAAEIIDWSIPCPSIFERKRPLAENTMRRIAEGIKRYVLEAAEPFILSYYGPKKPGEFRGVGIHEPIPTQTTENRFALISPTLIQTGYGERLGQTPRVPGLGKPLGTIVAGGQKHALVSAFLAKHYGGVTGQDLNNPTGTVTTKDHHALVVGRLTQSFRGSASQRLTEPMHSVTGRVKHGLVTSHLVKLRGTCRDGQSVRESMPTVTAGGTHIGEVRAFLIKYYGQGCGQVLADPAATVTTKDRMGLITMMVGGEPYVIADIGMRMLAPHELFRAQGFPDGYRIDIEVNSRRITKTDQVRMCGNSVCPPVARALAQANAGGIADELFQQTGTL